jgi:hypothetical protein
MEEKEILDLQIDEWKKKSELGDVCGILDCEDKPTVYCTHCGNWYCEIYSFIHEVVKCIIQK